MNKTKRIEVRLDEKELSLFKEKGKNYSSVGAMIRDAIKVFDDKMAIKKFDTINLLYEKMLEHHRNLKAIGNNINQLAHYANQLQIIREYPDSFSNEILDEIKKVEELISESINNDMKVFKYIVK